MDHTEDVSPMASPALMYTLTSIQWITPSVRRETAEEYEYEYEHGHALLAVTGGTGRLLLDEGEFGLGQGSCFLLVPGMKSRIESGKAELSYYLLTFEALGMPRAVEAEGMAEKRTTDTLPCRGEVVCSPFSTCLTWLEDIYEHRNTREELEVFRNHVRFHNVLLFLFQQNRGRAPEKDDNGWRQAVEHSIQHIVEHYNTPLTVEELAAIANIDRWKYTRLFKEVTGQVPLQYLNDVRIDRTKTLLRMTEDRLFDIAQHVGFNNEYYLNRRFKQKVGISPGQYRRNHREPMRVIAPFMEDFLVALDIVPVAQYSHTRWGRQDYLGLDHIPTFDEMSGSFESLSAHSPDFIMLKDRYDPRLYTQCRQISSTCVISRLSDDWRSMLRIVADLFGRSEQAEKVISAYEHKARMARVALHRKAGQQTVACLRVSADHMYLYGDQGFSGPVLHKDLGLLAYPLPGGADCTSRMARLTLEGLSCLSADHLFITFDKWHSQEPGAERWLLHDPVWQSLPAVRNGRVYEVDFLTWMNNGVISNGKKIDKVLQVLA